MSNLSSFLLSSILFFSSYTTQLNQGWQSTESISETQQTHTLTDQLVNKTDYLYTFYVAKSSTSSSSEISIVEKKGDKNLVKDNDY